MEPALRLWLAIINGVGITGFISAVLLNIGTWKNDMLFGFAILFGITRFIFYVIRQLQLRRLRELEIQNRKKHMDTDIFS